MDNALLLKMELDNGRELTDETISSGLFSSELVQSLTSEFSKNSLYPIWRLLALSEIPYAGRLKYTQELLQCIEKAYATSDGFSITGKSEDILPCYIGIAKSVKALLYYQNASKFQDEKVSEIIKKGTDYLLNHHLYQRLTNNEPITKHILNIAFPQSYQLNIVELLDIAYMTKNMNNHRVKPAIDFIKSRKTKDNDWRINYVKEKELNSTCNYYFIRNRISFCFYSESKALNV